MDVSKLQPTWLWVLDFEYPPPTIERQVKRMFCLTAMTILSATAEAVQGEDRTEEPRAMFKWASRWVREEANDELTDEEREWLNVPAEAWTDYQLVNGSWRFQAGAVIGWALGLTDWRPIWQSYDVEDFDFRFLGSSVEEVAAMAKPRPIAEIELKNSVVCAWLWRCRYAERPKQGFVAERSSRKHLADFVDELFKSGEFLQPIRGDYNVDGLPFQALQPADQRWIQSRATERLTALNWLAGQETDYAEITCDT